MLNIKRPETYELAKAVAERTGLSLTDAVTEALRDKLATHDPVLRQSDYETYVENKAALHPELGELSASSKTKIQQVLLLMLKEAGLLQKKPALGSICRPVLSPHVIAVIKDDDPCWLAGFLMPERELNN